MCLGLLTFPVNSVIIPLVLGWDPASLSSSPGNMEHILLFTPQGLVESAVPFRGLYWSSWVAEGITINSYLPLLPEVLQWPPGNHHVKEQWWDLRLVMWQLFYLFLVASVLSCWPGNKLAYCALECRFLTTGSPGKSVSLEYLVWITGSKPLVLCGNLVSIMIVFDNVQGRKDFDLL